MKTNAVLLTTLILTICSTGWSGTMNTADPVKALRQDPQVHRVEALAVRAVGAVFRVRLRSAQELYVMLSSEATSPAEAGQVRQIALWLNVASGRTVQAAGVRSLTHLAARLSTLCLDQGLTRVSDALHPWIGRTLPDLAVLRRFPNGATLEVVPSLPWATAGSSLKLTVPLRSGTPTPHCVLPSLSPR